MNNVEELKAELAKLKAAKEAVKNGGGIDPNTLETISKEKTAVVEPVVEKPVANVTPGSNTKENLAKRYDDIVGKNQASLKKQEDLLETAKTSYDIAKIKEEGLLERAGAREEIIVVKDCMDTLRVASEVREKAGSNAIDAQKTGSMGDNNTDDKSYVFTVAPKEIMTTGTRRLLVPANKIIEMAKKTHDTVLKKITGNNGEVDYEPTSMPEDMMSRFSYRLTERGKNVFGNIDGANIITNFPNAKSIQGAKSYVLAA